MTTREDTRLVTVKTVVVQLTKSKSFWRLISLVAVTFGVSQGLELAGVLGDVLNEALSGTLTDAPMGFGTR